ncbi:MAG: zinc ABC transporter substrate-binding protein [Pseudomonadales bacterium]
MLNVVFKGSLRGGCRVLMLLFLLLPMSLMAEAEVTEANTSDIKVLASIKPLQLIAQAITQSVSDTDVLLPAGTTPHDYALKPSDLGRVYDADLVLWLGAPYETYLAKPVGIRAANDLAVMSYGETDADVHHEGHGHENDSDNEHGHLYGDPHVWFSPEEAWAIAQTVAELLVQKDVAHASQYRANLAAFSDQLKRTDERIKARFTGQNELRYIVYHDAYSHFENHYGLEHLAAVTKQPESKPGAKSLLRLRRTIVEQKVACLFIEPQADLDIVNILKEGNSMQVYQMDPMATDIEATAQGYIQFLEQAAEQLLQCR